MGHKNVLLTLCFCCLSGIGLFGQSWVQSVSPAQNAVAAPLLPLVGLAFDRAIDTSTVTANLAVHSALEGRLAGFTLWDGGTNTLTWAPLDTLLVDDRLILTLGRGLRDTLGDSIPHPWMTEFRTMVSGGNGTFTEFSTTTIPGTGAWHMVAGDLDGDRDIDLVTANGIAGTLSILLNDGMANFSAASPLNPNNNPESVDLSDLDGDGDLDIISCGTSPNQMNWCLNNGGGSFTGCTPASASSNPHGIRAMDYDGDLRPDIVVSPFGASNPDLFANGLPGPFVATTGPPMGMGGERAILGDFDLDGDIDAALAAFSAGQTYILCNDSFAGMRTDTSYGTGPGSHIGAGGDFNGDGHKDLAIPVINNSRVVVLTNNGSAMSSTPLSLAAGPGHVATGDWDADGDLDLAASQYNGNNVQLLLNGGNANFSAFATLNNASSPYAACPGDFDGDGDLDIAVLARGEGRVRIFLNGPMTARLEAAAQPVVAGIPNPFSGQLQLQGDLPRAGQVRSLLRDLQGRIVLEGASAWHPAGAYRAAMDAEALSQGLYLLEVWQDGQRIAQQKLLKR